MAEKFGDRRLEAACARALYYGDPRYKRVKGILNSGLEMQPVEGPNQLSFKHFEFARKASEFFAEEVGSSC